MAATFDLWQQAYTLALQSADVYKQQGTPDALAEWLSNTLVPFFKDPNTVKYIGQWETVWGPAVFENTPSSTSYADNTMYVVANADQTVYVVAIAGTNPNSTYDEDTEDADVNNTSSWTLAFPGSQPPTGLDPYISVGTQLGVTALLGMADTYTNQNLVAFLKSLPASKTQQATLIFCGHSLAGALAPTLALAFFNPTGGQLILSNWKAVYVYPTAGPTPGNADFATFFSTVFPQIPPAPQTNSYQVWNMNVWNTIDVVPHAWNIAMLEEITTLYPASWTSPPYALDFAIDLAESQSNTGASTGAGPYAQCANQSLLGTFNNNIPVSDMLSFEDQALYQHTTAYDVLLNVQSLAPGSQNQAAFKPVVHALLTGKSARAR